MLLQNVCPDIPVRLHGFSSRSVSNFSRMFVKFCWKIHINSLISGVNLCKERNAHVKYILDDF